MDGAKIDLVMPSPRHTRFEVASGIGRLTFDRRGATVNTLGTAVLDEVESLLVELEGRRDLTGLLLLSAKPDTWIAGGDLEEFAAIESAAAAAFARRGQRLLDRVERLPYPVVAAIHGACLGGGLEVALACDARVASDADSTRLGLPELRLGLIPAAGGCQRLPRVVGLPSALELILQSKVLTPKKARRLGLIDEVVPRAALEAAAVRAVARGKRRPRTTLRDRLLAPIAIALARRAVRKKTHGLYPAPFAALDAIHAGVAKGHAAGSTVEADRFGALAMSPEARALIGLFFDVTEAKRTAAAFDVSPAARVVVLGAGFMGSGIATAAALAGCTVRLRDVSPEACARALRFAREHVDERVRRGSLERREADRALGRLSSGTGWEGVGDADLVVEAIFEELGAKRAALAETEARGREDVVFASNTSTIPIADIAAGARRPENVLGMHFFSPVHRMPLLEVIRTKRTSDRAIALAAELGRRLGKTVIVVRDGPGFYTSRILAPYLVEAAHLLDEGARVEAIDRAAEGLGFPVGPVTLLDEVGIDIAAHAAGVVAAAFGERMAVPDALAAVLASGRMGRKNGRGFYLYESGRKRGVDESVYNCFRVARRALPVDADERLLLAMTGEALRALEDGVLEDARDGDLGAVLGLGYPPPHGGPFRYVDGVGAAPLLARFEDLEARHGIRFTPPEILRDAARAGRRFRSRTKTVDDRTAAPEPAVVT